MFNTAKSPEEDMCGKTFSNGQEESVSITDPAAERMIEYLISKKKIPADLPKALITSSRDPKAPNVSPKHLIPTETESTECRHDHLLRSTYLRLILYSCLKAIEKLPLRKMSLHVLEAVLQEVVLTQGDAAYFPLALTCNHFESIVSDPGFRKKADFAWLDVVPKTGPQVAIAALGENKEGRERHRRNKQESLSRSKRRWVLTTIELEEELKVDYPYKISLMNNLKKEDIGHEFHIKGEGVEDGLFTIDKMTGDVYAHWPVDREKKASYHITFDVLDEENRETVDRELSFDVKIKDINDNAPRFIKPMKQANVKENTKPGEYLPVSMEVVDDDEENTINSTVDVTVGKQTPAEPKIGIKKIVGRTHQLISEGCFDYDKIKQYSIDIKASDRGNPPLFSTMTVELNIIDTNSHQPKFKERQYEAEAMEMQKLDDVLRVAVEDKDTPGTDGWRAKYFFISGNEDGIYKITTDPKTNEGIIGVVKEKNFDVTTLVKLQIGVENIEPLTVCKDGKLITDSSKLPPQDSVSITVKMFDTNDAPVFEKYTDKVYQMEESEPGQVLYTPKVHDNDSSNFRFELFEDPADWVTIDEKTGKITTIEKMDRESPFVDENDIYTIVIAAIDDGSPPATSTCTISVHLRDINDNSPTLLNKTAILCANHANKVTVHAKDADVEPYGGPFSFTLADDKTVRECWKLDPAYGEEVGIVSLKNLNYGNYSVPLVIEDKQNQAKEESLNVVVCNCDETGVCREPKPHLCSL
ncbi:cadherin-like protein 26 [Anableps anableps]